MSAGCVFESPLSESIYGSFFFVCSFARTSASLPLFIFLWNNCFYYSSSTCDSASTFWTSVIDLISWLQQVYFKATDPFNERWRSAWIITAFWDILAFALLSVICYLWAPSQSSQRYVIICKNLYSQQDGPLLNWNFWCRNVVWDSVCWRKLWKHFSKFLLVSKFWIAFLKKVIWEKFYPYI